MEDTLYIVVPCYNEQEVLPETARRLSEKLAELKNQGKIGAASRIMFVNDGSKDQTWSMIGELCAQDVVFAGVNLSRNRGHQNALLAGISTAVSHAEIVYNHADYRLLSRRAAEALLSFDEVNLFLRGIVLMVGFRSTTVSYERGERFAGKSKYPLGKMLTFALEGITSLSIKPIWMITIGGLLVCLVSLVMLVKAFVDYSLGNVVPGWTSVIISIWVLGGLQLFAIGIIGEYIGKTYMETKARPKFIIESVLLSEEKDGES